MSFNLQRTLEEKRTLNDAYVVFRSVETTLTDGSKVYDVVCRTVVGGEIADISYCQSELEALELAARLNSALLRDRTEPKTGYVNAATRIGDGCPG